MSSVKGAILIFSIFSKVISNQDLTVTLHKCCQKGEVLNLHTKKCTEDRKDRSHNQTLKVFPVPFKDDHIYYPVNYDFVMIEKCHVSEKINIHFDVYGKYENLKFFDPHGVQEIARTGVCFDLGDDERTDSRAMVAQKCLECHGPCINFCCPKGYVKEDRDCRVPREERNGSQSLSYLPSNFTRVTAKLHCEKVLQFDSSLFRVNGDNKVEINGVLRDTSEYCVDEFDDQVNLCEIIETRKVTKIVTMSISIVALILVMILHLVIEDLRVNHITKLKIPLYLCILLSFLIVVISQEAGVNFLQSKACIFLGLLLQFSALSVFFWLTSISVDVWLTFKAFKNPMNEVSRIRESYLFSIVSPMMITLTTMFLQFYDSPDTDNYLHPG